MTRFEMELNGVLGDFWMKDAMKRIKDMEAQVESGELIISKGNGVPRWKSNNRIIPADCCEVLAHTHFAHLYDEVNTKIERDSENEAFFAEYRKANAHHVLSDEERFEMTAAFGKGAVVVDVITGKKYRL